jgi:hypothetical protein
LKDRQKGQQQWEDEEADISSYWMTLQNERILEIERGSVTLHSVQNSLWKRL